MSSLVKVGVRGVRSPESTGRYRHPQLCEWGQGSSECRDLSRPCSVPRAAVGPVGPAQEGAAFSHSVAFSVKLCVSTASCCSHSAPRASLPPLSTDPPPRRGDRFPLLSGPRVWSSAAQRFTGSPGSGLHRYLLLDPTARRKPEQGQHTRTSVLPGESLSHGGSTGMREAGEGEGCQQLERRRDSSRVQEECCGTGSGGFFRRGSPSRTVLH